MLFTILDFPIGRLLLARDDRGLAAIQFDPQPHDDWTPDDSAFAGERAQLDEYFAGKRRTFELKLAPRGTSFQLEVWAALRAIPYGETRSYREIARTIGRPDAIRAVGAANGANPLPIVVPCHRVIGANGSLTGFGGGLPVKRYLLDLEQGALF
ncbi:MAG TPA: methylated-DNA--[protein]-cysteine S-methyltransferase [Thermoanaerobaculia bacterium]|nr:methylated-DNA--[protein]-cysteine S-methyltransferase [Thermoanaerobaculia bacterium]